MAKATPAPAEGAEYRARPALHALLKPAASRLNNMVRTPPGVRLEMLSGPSGGQKRWSLLTGGLVMRHVDFTPFYRSTVGFDRV